MATVRTQHEHVQAEWSVDADDALDDNAIEALAAMLIAAANEETEDQ